MNNDNLTPGEPEDEEFLVAPLGYHCARGLVERLPHFLPVPSCIRVIKDGLILDEWVIALPFAKSQMAWLIDMMHLWFLLDDSPENTRWLSGVLDAIETGHLRCWESRRFAK